MKNKNPGHYNDPLKPFDVICTNKDCEAEWTVDSEKDIISTYNKKGCWEVTCLICKYPIKIDSKYLPPGLKEKLEKNRKYEDWDIK
jgi:hypothetical protein